VGNPIKVSIDVGDRATPITVDWNSDGRKDLVVGATDGRIHLFLNEGADTEPDFLSETFAQDNGVDLDVGTRSSPVVLDLDGDGKKDLLTGNYEGQLRFYSNTGTAAAPSFSGSVLVEADGTAIDLPGSPRSRQFVADWDDDGLLDVLIGAGDGNVHLYRSVPIPGDIDGDGNLDMDDVAAFIAVLLGNPMDPHHVERSNLDGEEPVDGRDIQPFVALMTG
jgi:hypothetical protein